MGRASDCISDVPPFRECYKAGLNLGCGAIAIFVHAGFIRAGNNCINGPLSGNNFHFRSPFHTYFMYILYLLIRRYGKNIVCHDFSMKHTTIWIKIQLLPAQLRF